MKCCRSNKILPSSMHFLMHSVVFPSASSQAVLTIFKELDNVTNQMNTLLGSLFMNDRCDCSFWSDNRIFYYFGHAQFVIAAFCAVKFPIFNRKNVKLSVSYSWKTNSILEQFRGSFANLIARHKSRKELSNDRLGHDVTIFSNFCINNNFPSSARLEQCPRNRKDIRNY